MMRHLCDWCSCKAGLVLRGAGVNLSHPSPYSYKAFHNGVWINLSKVFLQDRCVLALIHSRCNLQRPDNSI